MNAPQIHPEDLLDRARRGSLTAEEQRLLDKHLALCVACRFELSLAPAFYTQIELGPQDDALLARAIARTVSVPWYRRRRVPRRVWGAIAAVAIVSAGSAAAYSRHVRTVAPKAVMNGSNEGHVDEVRSATPAAPRVEAPPVIETPPAIEAPAIDAPPRAARAPRHALVPSAPNAPAPSAIDSAVTCAEGFRNANQARRDGAAATAITLYRELRTICAGSTEELSSRVLMGRIYLDRMGDPEHALGAFDSYLASGAAGPLREDALIGRALSLGKLSRRSEERNAWQALLASYPDSIYAEKAKARLNELH
jgi:hypothetical protein